ncbi:MAG: hypothetical protein M3Q16_05335 [Pseudomonadota bacterium]|nr:hypothetical protein [Pseudomonadota bacterium]
MSKLNVAVPWNQARYIPCNGFHPLYRALFENNPLLSFNILDEVAFAKRLSEDNAYASEIFEQVARMPEPFAKKCSDLPLGRKFVDYITRDELWLTSELPGDIEFHHTSPLTNGERPFVFHCESFLPIFMPFANQGNGAIKNSNELRKFYGQLLSSKNCLGIFSHVPETLDQIRNFFGNDQVSEKLRRSRIGLADHTLKILLDARKDYCAERPIFLFTNSAHQNPRSFALRGGIISLLFAEKFLRSGRDALFIFRTARPMDRELRGWGVDLVFMHSVENRQIMWLEGHVSEHEQLRLFMTADVLLLPSVNLHSVTIMQALAAGAIPVVTDTYGPDLYVKDGQNGIILKGVRNAVWLEDTVERAIADKHQNFKGLTAGLVEQMYSRIRVLIDNPQYLLDMRARGRIRVKDEFSGIAFRDQMSEEIVGLWHAQKEKKEVKNRSLLHGAVLASPSKLKRLFESPTQPLLLLSTGYEKVYSCKGEFFYCASEATIYGFDKFSVLAAKRQRQLGTKGIIIAGVLRDLEVHLLSLEKVGRDSGPLAFKLQYRIMEWTRPYPIVFSLFKKIYFLPRKVRRLFSLDGVADIREWVRPYPAVFSVLKGLWSIQLKVRQVISPK